MTVPPDTPAGAEVRSAAIAATRWVAGTRLVIEVLALGSSILLAHLLLPAEFGRAVVVLPAVPLTSILLGGVISPLLVQRAELTREHLEAASALALLAGAAVTLLALATSPLLAAAVDAQTGALMLLLAPALMLAAPATVPDALLRRRLEFRVLGIVEAVAVLAGLLVTVVLALSGAGSEALVLGPAAGIVVGTLGLCAVRRPPRPRWHAREARELLRFGLPAGASALGALVFRQVDYLVLAARRGPADTGAYWRGYQLGAEYQTKLTTVMLRVAFPLYSRMRDLDELKRVRRRVVRLHGILVLPALSLLIAVAPVAVPFVFGEAWEAAVVPTQLLAGAGMLNAVTTGIGPLLMAVGRSASLARFTWIAGAGYALVIFLVAPAGVNAVAAAALAFTAAGFVATHEILLRRAVGISALDVLREIWPAAAIGALIAAVAAPLAAVLDDAGVSAPLVLLAASGLAVAVFVALAPRLAPDAWADLRAVLSRQRGRMTRAGAPAARTPDGTS